MRCANCGTKYKKKELVDAGGKWEEDMDMAASWLEYKPKLVCQSCFKQLNPNGIDIKWYKELAHRHAKRLFEICLPKGERR